VMQDNETSEVEAPELDATPDQESQVVEPVAGEIQEAEQETEEYEIVEREPEPSRDGEKQNNAAFAKMRIKERQAKKKAEELERQLEAVKQGNVPESLQEQLTVAAKAPEQPNINDFLSDEALSKYDYDREKALAAYNAAGNRWMIEAQNANQASQVQTTQVRNQYIEQQQRNIKVLNNFNRAADEMNISGFDDAETSLVELTGTPDVIPAIADVFGDDTKQAVAVVNYLGRNEHEAQRILQMAKTDPNGANRELFKLGYQKLQIRRKDAASKPMADSGLTGGTAGGTESWKGDLNKLLSSGDTSKFRAAKREVEKRLGRSISYDELE